MPDDALAEKADDGSLARPDVLASEVRRMMADPKASALVDNFAAQWLDTRDMLLISPFPELYPGVTPTLKQAMHDETALFFQAFLSEQRSALDLLDANFTFLNQELAAFYGISGVGGDAMQRVTVQTDSNRGGILRQAGVLAVNSLPTRTSIVRRGKWVLSQLLCQAPNPPPPNIPPLPMQVPPGATQRELLQIHAGSGICAGCHDVIDPFGFALENFDASGRYRTTENGKPIDASATLWGQSFDGPAALAELIKGNPALPACMAEMAYTYAAGRSKQADDAAVLSGITERFLAGGAHLADLFVDVATDAAFGGHCAP